jgi:transcriptional regulator with XRE-family HTH domain
MELARAKPSCLTFHLRSVLDLKASLRLGQHPIVLRYTKVEQNRISLVLADCWVVDSACLLYVIEPTSPNARRVRRSNLMPDSHASALDQYQIGLKLRRLRMGKQLTLSRLAAETGLSIALLSKLESGRMTPTLQTLSKICRVYGVSLSYFFSDSKRHSLSITRKGHLAAIRGSQDSVRQIPLHYDHIGAARFGVNLLEFPPKVLVAASEPGQGLSCLIYVVEGRLDMNIGGDKDVLDAGDCACIDTDMVIVWGSATEKCCQLLFVKL